MTDDLLRQELEHLRARNKELEESLRRVEDSCLEYGSDSALFLSGPMVLFKWSMTEGWPVSYVSPNVKELFGYSQDDFASGKIDYGETVHPDDVDHVKREIHDHLARGSESFTHSPYRIVTRSGEERWVLDHTAVLRNADGEPRWFVGYLLDITARVEAEEALRQSDERWLFALEGSRDGVWDWNAETNEVFFSRRWKEMLGYESHEIPSALEEWDKRLHPDDRERTYADLTAHLQGRTPYYENIHRLRCKDGNYKWILDRGKVVEWKDDGTALRVIGTHTDITERKLDEDRLRKSQARLAMAQRLARLGSWSWDRDNNKAYWSDEIFRIYERDPDLGPPSPKEYLAYQHPEDRKRVFHVLANAMKTETEFDMEHRIVTAGGRVKHVHVIGQTETDANGKIKGMFGTAQDITQAMEAKAELERLATLDSLTGLLNRRRFMELAQREIERARRYAHPLSVIMFDADHFKSVNDTHGHATGDRVLKAIAECASAELREVDILGRVGGEEFAVVLPETPLAGALPVAERIRETIADRHILLVEDGTVNITVSLGVADCPNDAPGLDSLLQRADAALYLAKQRGRNRTEAAAP